MGDGKVQIAYLHATRVSHSWHSSMMRLMIHDIAGAQVVGGPPHEIRTDSGGLVEGRNLAVSTFLDETDDEWLFFVDTDMGFQADALDRLLAAADPTERPVVGGLCFALREFKGDGKGGRRVMPAPTLYRWARKPDTGHIGFSTIWDVPVDQVTRVAGTGGAFLLIHRGALQRVRERFGDQWFDHVRYADGRPVSEDLSFCWRLHLVGAPVHVHTGVQVTHHKEFWLDAQDYHPPAHLLEADRRAPEFSPDVDHESALRTLDALSDPEPAAVGPVLGEPRISLLCPTRGRPQSMRRLVASVDETAAGPVEIVFYLDEDDHESIAMAKELLDARGGGIVPIAGPRIVLSQMWNECYRHAGADVLMHAGDDIVFKTTRWDDLVIEAFEQHPDRIALVHGNDLLQGPNLATHGFLHRRWVEAVGYFVPPYFSSDWNDTWLTEVADAIGRRVYLPNLVTEHLHPLAGKATWDVTHQERLDRGARDDVAALYASKADERAADAAVLRSAMTAVAA